ncbi:MAG: nucleoside-diphosphate kinase [bacterium]
MEKTLIIIKHDGVARGLLGDIIKRFERVGLKLVGLEFIQSTDDLGHSHYPTTEKWFSTVGNRTLKDYQAKGISTLANFGSEDPIEIGKTVKEWNVEYLTFGPVLAMVWEGPGAVVIGRKLTGETIPLKAAPGTIRGDFSVDNIELANAQKRPMYNLIHASGEIAEAKEEIALWFDEAEIFEYKTYANELMGVYSKLK